MVLGEPANVLHDCFWHDTDAKKKEKKTARSTKQAVEKEKINVHIEKKLYPNSLYWAAGLQTSNGFSCSVNHLSGGGVNTNHNATH